MTTSRCSPNILLFSDPKVGEEHGYNDRWDGDEYHYAGEGQRGDQEFKRTNRALLRHKETGRAVRVFQGVRGIVTYVGEFELAADPGYYLVDAKATGTTALRKVIMFRLVPVGDVNQPRQR